MWLKIVFLNVRERVEVVERKKDGPLLSPVVPSIVSVRERKTFREEKYCIKKMVNYGELLRQTVITFKT